MYKVLVIGCGNIGAQYDLYNDEVQSHVKAWHLNPLTTVSIYDINASLAQTISHKYACEIVESIDTATLVNFDCVSICTPTTTHFGLLEKAINANVKTVICEKPVSNNDDDLEQIKHIYYKNNSKIIVNYIRRFLPDYADLKTFIASTLVNEEVTNINIRYQRGFINNCSHAFDLIGYLMNKEITLHNISKSNMVTDHFKDDPTLSIQALWENINFSVQGLSGVYFSHFEIDIYFKYYKIIIKNAGDVIEVYKSTKAIENLKPLIIQPEYTKHNCLKNYMLYVTDYAVKLMSGTVTDDNFINAVALNEKMLNYKNN